MPRIIAREASKTVALGKPRGTMLPQARLRSLTSAGFVHVILVGVVVNNSCIYILVIKVWVVRCHKLRNESICGFVRHFRSAAPAARAGDQFINVFEGFVSR